MATVSLKTMPLSTSHSASRVLRTPRSKAVRVRAGKKEQSLEEAWQAQQDLLAERRQKAAEQQAGLSSSRYTPRTRDSAPPAPSAPRTTPKVSVRTPKAEPKLLIEEEEEEEEKSKPGNPLGFLGKLFGKK